MNAESGTVPAESGRKHSIRASTSYARRQRFIDAFNSIMSDTRSFRRTHDEHNAALHSRIFGHPEYRTLHQSDRAYIAGYMDARRGEFWGRSPGSPVEWRVYLKGAYILGRDVPAGMWANVDSDAGQYFWAGESVYGYRRPWTGPVHFGPPHPDFAAFE